MKLKLIRPSQAMPRAFVHQPIPREGLDRFKAALQQLFDNIRVGETKEHEKTTLRDFLLASFYGSSNALNTTGRIDLVIHHAEKTSSPIAVMFEVKRPLNRSEMIAKDHLNRKAFHELILYFFRERLVNGNLGVKHLVVTNLNEWFIFEAVDIERLFLRNTALKKKFFDFEANRLSVNRTEGFYREVLHPYIDSVDDELSCTWFDLRVFEAAAQSAPGDPCEAKLTELYRVLAPAHLLKRPFANDNDTLNRTFYAELLHLIGLRERKLNSKTLIERKAPENRDPASILENAISQLEQRDKHHTRSLASYGDSDEERLFAIGLELAMTWMNRVLFCKLLEAQLQSYRQPLGEGRFLNSKRLTSFTDLEQLIFGVLNRPTQARRQGLVERFSEVPYLNSSLFEETRLENETISIGNLDDRLELPIARGTVLRDSTGRRLTGSLPALEYLLRFLDAYNFASEQGSDIDESGRDLINSAVLGLIFEKINGYQDGSYYTPGSITMHLARETIRRAVIDRFAAHPDYIGVTSFGEIRERLDHVNSQARAVANDLINGLRVVDPAVGSGHFLVSALNEIIAIKSDLKILSYKDDGLRIREYELSVENDELVIIDVETEMPFRYTVNRQGKPFRAQQRLQETLFHEKRRIIEGCLFGVDLNRHSVSICRLRLWIELLKNAYYTQESDYRELETLPNIDINIRVGNSLLSQYSLIADAEMSPDWVGTLCHAMAAYRSARGSQMKAAFRERVETLKANTREKFHAAVPLRIKIAKAKIRLMALEDQIEMFPLSSSQTAARQKKINALKRSIERDSAKLAEADASHIYQDGFEWRFEFPEVLDDDGQFRGFDALLANPPYLSAMEMRRSIDPRVRAQLKRTYITDKGAIDMYVLFFERALQLLRPGGHAALITPNKFLSAKYGKSLREFLSAEARIDAVLDYSSVPVFADASVYPVITQLRKAPQGDAPIMVGASHDGQAPTYLKSVSPDVVARSPERNMGFLLNDRIDIVQKMMSLCEPLTKAAIVQATSTAGEAAAYNALIGEQGYKLINTGTIDPWVNLWGEKPLRDQKKTYLRPKLPRDSDQISNARHRMYRAPKIIFAKTALRVEAFYDAHGDYASINTNCLHSFNPDYDPLFLLGWLHSEAFNYAYGCFYDALRMSGGYLPFTAPYLRAMFVPRDFDQGPVITLVRQIVDRRGDDELEAALDDLFFKGLGLTADEVNKIQDMAPHPPSLG